MFFSHSPSSPGIQFDRFEDLILSASVTSHSDQVDEKISEMQLEMYRTRRAGTLSGGAQAADRNVDECRGSKLRTVEEIEKQIETATERREGHLCTKFTEGSPQVLVVPVEFPCTK